MPKYILTIGQKYRHEPHPLNLHPDNYYVLEAPSYEDARDLIFERIGNQWAFLYSEDEFKPTFFPGVELPFPSEPSHD